MSNKLIGEDSISHNVTGICVRATGSIAAERVRPAACSRRRDQIENSG